MASFPGGSVVKNLPAMQETGFDSWVGKIPWRRKWQSTPVFLPGKSHRQRNLVSYSPWSLKESDTTEGLKHTYKWLSDQHTHAYISVAKELPGWLSSKEPACDAEDTGDVMGSIPGLGRFPGGGHGNPLQYSCPENSMDRGALWATIHGVANSQT